MKWRKRGHIFKPNGTSPSWAVHSALQPTPLVIGNRIRLFVGLRDAAGVSRVGWVDVDAEDPSRVLQVSASAALDIGEPGAFDDNGVVPCAVVERPEGLFLYYAGYQLGHRVRFLVLGGLAVSRNGGQSFERWQRVPVMERTDTELCFRVIHSIRQEGDRWRAWYGGGGEWQQGDGKSLAVYDIRHTTSGDGIHFDPKGSVCVPIAGGDEHRVGRPFVFHDGAKYRMFFGSGTRTHLYRLAYAESTDGLNWSRDDTKLRGLEPSVEGWDSTMMGYPSVVAWRERVYMFYNGNDMGREGFGWAELEHW